MILLPAIDIRDGHAVRLERGAVYGVQYHPEKSGRHGLQLLANFTRICAAA